MATKTQNLKLILPAFSEFYNAWHIPVNTNFTLIDTAVGALEAEVTAARGSSTDLDTRISTAIAADGSLNPVPEIVSARSSRTYGVAGSLSARVDNVDVETWYARQQLGGLLDSVAWAQDDVVNNAMVSGPTNPLTFSGAVVTLNGSVTPVVSNINGYRQSTRTNPQTTISGTAGTYYLTLARTAGGNVFFTAPAASGTTSVDGLTNYLSIFSASATNFVTAGAKPGDILRITAPPGNPNLGDWIIQATNVEDPSNLAANQIRIKGQFASAVGGLSSSLVDVVSPTLSFTATANPGEFARQTGYIYVGSCVFDGSNVTSLIAYSYNGKFSEWQQVTPIGGNFSLTFNHDLGYIPRKITIYGSQANDFSQPLEPLCVAGITTGSVSLTAGDQSVTYTAPTLNRSVIARVTPTALLVKNTTNGIFYTDYNGNPQTNGYLYISVER